MLLVVGCAETEATLAPLPDLAPTFTPPAEVTPKSTPTGTAVPLPPLIPAVVSTSTVEPTVETDISYNRRTPFVPLDSPQFLTAREATYLLEDELVLGLEWEDEARAYPISMVRFHHIVNDTVGGRPILATY